MAIFSTPPKSICVLRLSAIGDVCNAIASVQAIQHHWPSSQITWVTGKLEAELLSAVPNIRVITFDKKQGIKAYIKLWQELKNERFDALLHMQYAIRASIVSLGIRAKYRLGFDKKRAKDGQRFFTNYKVPSPHSAHVLDGFCSFAHSLGVPDFKPSWSLSYNSEYALWAEKIFNQKAHNLVVVPGASKAYKNWTARGYADVIKHAQKKGYNVILAGSPSPIEISLGSDIEGLVDEPITNVIGQSSLLEMLALLDKASLVISPDTGPAHMANAVATPVIGLYAHHNPARTGPYCYQEYVVSAYDEALKAENEQSLKDLDWRTRVKAEDAMQRITSDKVIEKFEQVTAHIATKRD
ncbi:glycosyltransferase family 9 protein [Vibrio astriarenae]